MQREDLLSLSSIFKDTVRNAASLPVTITEGAKISPPDKTM